MLFCGALGLATLFLSFVLLALVLKESRYYARYTAPLGANSSTFPPNAAAQRVHELRYFSVELFNPNIGRAIEFYPTDNPMHNARYVGAFFLPLLVLFCFRKWTLTERWLALNAFLLFCICLAPPFLCTLIYAIPYFALLRNLYYFYTHYWQFILILLAGCSLDYLFESEISKTTGDQFLKVLDYLCLTVTVLILIYGSKSADFAAHDTSFQGNLRFFVIIMLITLLLSQFLRAPDKQFRSLAIWVFLILAITDLSVYYREVCEQDEQFTMQLWGHRSVFSPATKSALQSTWRQPTQITDYSGNITSNMPIFNDLWPENRYIRPSYLTGLDMMDTSLANFAMWGPPLALFDFKGSRFKGGSPKPPDAGTFRPQTHLLIPSSALSGALSYTFVDWGFNHTSLNLNAKRHGWLFIRQIYDPNWVIRLDGTRMNSTSANFAGMVIPISSGVHHLQMDFWPAARKVYWPATYLLEITLGVFLVISAYCSIICEEL